MIAMAVVNRPSLLIADEPTTALDVTIQAQVLELLAELREKFSLAMLFISHDLAVVSQVAHRIGVMYAGSVVEMGTAQDVFRNPTAPLHARPVKLGADLALRSRQAAADNRGHGPGHLGDAGRVHLRASLQRARSQLRRCPASSGRSNTWAFRALSRAGAGGSLNPCACFCSATFTPTWRHWRPASKQLRQYDHMANLGDVVGYNASPNEVCARIREMNCPVVRGNHDRACSGLSNLSEFNLVAAMSARWTQMTLDPDHQEWLRNLPEGPLRSDELPGVELVHGSPRDEDEYVLNAPTAALDFHLPGHSDVIFFGHTHVQGGFAFNVQDGKTRPLMPKYPNAGRHCAVEVATGGGRALPDQSRIGRPAAR